VFHLKNFYAELMFVLNKLGRHTTSKVFQAVNRVPTHFKKAFSILFQNLFNTKLKNFNTITHPHFSKILFMGHNVKTFAKLS